jgi:predicted CxxxxCH...CXXCH cytochrome family protein
MRKLWLTAAIAAVPLALLAFVQVQDTAAPAAAPEQQAEADPTAQPIAFPHNVHAGTYQMQCMYCHFSAERSVDAGIPPVRTCMGCHLMVNGRQNPEEVTKLRDFFTRQEAIPWVRIYKVADHVHFPHMRHVNARTASYPEGITCQTCHGEVQEMGVLTERSPVWGGDNMGWCVSCHVREGASRDCTVCHY